jgi:prevent-host-death family protein
MRTVNIHEAETNLSELVEQAVNGESFIIAREGKPLVKVTAIEAPVEARPRRLGFLSGQISVPDDFDHMGSNHIAQLFSGEP